MAKQCQTLVYLVCVLAVTFLLFGCDPSGNKDPKIDGQIMIPSTITAGETKELRVKASDPDGDPITYTWSTIRGSVEPTGPVKDPVVTYTAPDKPGDDTVTVVVSDARGGIDEDSIVFTVVEPSVPTPIQTPISTPTPIQTPISTPTPIPSPTLVIGDPQNGDSVPWEIIVKGTSEDIPSRHNIWVCVFPPDMRYYPQPGPAAEVVGGEWLNATHVGAGPNEDKEKEFAIFAVLADEAASEKFAEYIEACEDANDWPGMTSLPGGSIISDQISVIRN